MIFYGERNVYEAAKLRIRKIFDDHFGKVPLTVSFSGGKDSTTVLFLIKEIMDERGIDKIPVFWCDQEFESPMVVDYARWAFSLPWVEPYWVQSKYPKFNAHSGKMEYAWDDSRQYLREKESIYNNFDLSEYSSCTNEYDFFLYKLFGEGCVTIGGLHIDESPTRRLSLLRSKGECPKTPSKKTIIYYPIFDWTVKDVWYYIYSRRHKYCLLYNYLFSKMPLKLCRVGSFWNEQSLATLKIQREISPAFYDKASLIIPGINTTKNTISEFIQYTKIVPPYFKDREEYALYLVDNLVPEKHRKNFIKSYYTKKKSLFKMRDKGYVKATDEIINEKLGQALCICVLRNDYGLRALSNLQI